MKIYDCGEPGRECDRVLPVLHLAILLEGRSVEDLTVDNLSAVMYLKNQASEVSLEPTAYIGPFEC